MQQEFIKINNCKILVKTQGQGIPLLLIPGGPGFGDYLSPVADLVDDLVMPIRFDPRGCGWSDKLGSFDFETEIEDIEQIRSRQGINQWIVGGHSFGANVALVYAMTYPRYSSGVLYLSGSGFQNNREWRETMRKNQLARKEEKPEFEHSINLEVNDIGNRSWRKFIQHPMLWKNLSSLDVPVHFIQSELDIRPNWPAKQLHSLLKKSSYYEVTNAGHYPWLTQPDEFKEIVRSKVKDLINK